MNYDERTFRSILETVLSKGYSFDVFDKDLSKRSFILRHDVDISPISALRLAGIESSLDICGNFFFHLGADTYNIFDSRVVDLMHEIAGMNHLVGLHIDNKMFSNEDCVYSVLQSLSDVLGLKHVVSFHRPNPEILGKKYVKFISAYDEKYFSKDNYASDSRMNHDFLHRVNQLLIGDASPVQLLLHPVWWSEVEIGLELVERRLHDLRRYLSLNFGAVFGDYHEDRTFRV